MPNPPLLLRTIALQTAAAPPFEVVAILILGAALALFSLARVFRRAGYPGWAAFVPIYNTVVLLRIGGLSPLWLLLLIIPIANVFVLLALSVGVARAFRHGIAFAAGLWLVPFVFYPILAFGKSEPTMRHA